MDDLGTRFRKLRLQRSLTQSQLAEPDYSYAYVSTIEAGRRTPSPKALEFFAAKLGVDPKELATGRSPATELDLTVEYLQARSQMASGEEVDLQAADSTFRRIAKKARQVALHDLEARASLGFAMVAEMRNDLPQALALYQQVEKAPDELQLTTRIDAVAGHARVLQSQGRTVYAAFLLREALAKLEEAGLDDPAALVRIHTSLVAAYFMEGLVTEAVESANIAETLAPQVEDPERLADMSLNVGIMLTKQRRFKEAEKRLADAEHWFTELGRTIDRADVQLVRGMKLGEEGRYEEASQLLEAAQAVFTGAGAHLRECRALLALGTNARISGDAERARFFLKRTLALAGEEKGVRGIAHRELGLCDVEVDQAKAVKQIRKAISILKDAGNGRELAATYNALGDVLSQTEELAPACDAYRTAAEVLMQVA